jgi:8-oxo-dGDP phosphatase
MNYKVQHFHLNFFVGGCLKTPKDADSESLQAKWIKDLGELNLRANDIHTIIERAKSYHLRKDESWHGCILPAVRPHQKLLLRLVVCIRKRSKYEQHVFFFHKIAFIFSFHHHEVS